MKDGDRVLDLGCGNGRLLLVLREKKIDYIGVDISEKLIKIAKKNFPDKKFQLVSPLNFPFPENYFDKVFCIRVLPHIPSQELRLSFLKKIFKILKPQGILILSCWYLWNFKNKKNLFLVIRNCLLKILGRSKLDFGDALVPWQNKIMRYYHFFTQSGLKKLVRGAGFKIKEVWESNFDIFLIGEKD